MTITTSNKIIFRKELFIFINYVVDKTSVVPPPSAVSQAKKFRPPLKTASKSNKYIPKPIPHQLGNLKTYSKYLLSFTQTFTGENFFFAITKHNSFALKIDLR